MGQLLSSKQSFEGSSFLKRRFFQVATVERFPLLKF